MRTVPVIHGYQSDMWINVNVYLKFSFSLIYNKVKDLEIPLK